MRTPRSADASVRAPRGARFLRALFALAAFASVLVHTVLAAYSPDVPVAVGLPQIDVIDTPLTLAGLHSHPTFLSTFDWWHGPWAAGPGVPFWRPLTSQAFWLEDRLLATFPSWRPQPFNISVHLVFVAVFTLYVRRLLRSDTLAVLAAFLFAGSSRLVALASGLTATALGSGFRFSWGPEWHTLDQWQNQPEAWTGAAVLGAALAALNGRWTAGLFC